MPSGFFDKGAAMKRIFACSLFLAVLVPAAGRGQGVYVETVTIEKGQEPAAVAADPKKVAKAFTMPGKYRHEQGSGTAMIVRLDRKMLYSLDPKEKTYYETGIEEMKAGMEAAGDMMAKQREEMRARLAEMPEAQRKMVEQSMGKMFAPDASQPKAELKVNATGETKKLCGYSCQKYVVTENDKEVLVAWTTKDIPEIEAMRKDWEEMTKSMSSLGSAFGVRIAEAYQKIGGFPLENESLGIHTVTTKVERKAIPDDLFNVPEGYTRTASPLAGMGAVTDPKAVRPGKKPPVELKAPKLEPAPAPALNVVVKFCAGCGKKLVPGSRFCGECGKKIGG